MSTTRDKEITARPSNVRSADESLNLSGFAIGSGSMSSGKITVHPPALVSSGEALRQVAGATRDSLASVHSVVASATPLLAIPVVEIALERFWQRYAAVLQLSTEVLDEIAHDVGVSATNYTASDGRSATAFNQTSVNLTGGVAAPVAS